MIYLTSVICIYFSCQFDWINWGSGQPDNWGDTGEDCAHMYWDEIGAGIWNDLPCTATSGYMCKKAKGETIKMYRVSPPPFFSKQKFSPSNNAMVEKIFLGASNFDPV